MKKSKTLNELTRKELLAVKHRKWGNVSPRYDSILVLADGRTHDSGWGVMAVIGVRKQKIVEICTMCSDDLDWQLPDVFRFGPKKEYRSGQMRCDCAVKSGALHFWCEGEKRFQVGAAVSSCTVTLHPAP